MVVISNVVVVVVDVGIVVVSVVCSEVLEGSVVVLPDSVVAGSVTPPVTVAMVGTMDPAAIVDAPWIAS